MIVLISCNEPKIQSINQPTKPLEELKERVRRSGDAQAYEELSTAYMNEGINEILPYSL